MDSHTLAKLAAIGDSLILPPREPSLEEIQTQRTQEEAARKELLDSLRERVTAAIVLLLGSREMESGKTQNAEMARLNREFEASPDPEAFVLDLERQAEEASIRGKAARDNRTRR